MVGHTGIWEAFKQWRDLQSSVQDEEVRHLVIVYQKNNTSCVFCLSSEELKPLQALEKREQTETIVELCKPEIRSVDDVLRVEIFENIKVMELDAGHGFLTQK